jgi:hypoxanthine phosphoribosyltransferase
MKGKKRPDFSEWNRKNKSQYARDWYSNPLNKEKEEIRRVKIGIGNKGKIGSRGEHNGRWMGGISKGKYGWEFNKELKLAVLIRDKHICQICKTSLADKYMIHHIDYDKKNNKLENLVSLCNSCHSKTNKDRHTWIRYFERIRNMPLKYVSWSTINESCDKIYDYLKEKKISGVVPIIRGGVIPAVILSYKLNVPIKYEVQNDTDVIVDEIVDFGLTLQRYKIKYPNNLFVCIHLNTKNYKLKNIKPDFYVEEVENVFIVYPWEESNNTVST